MSFGGPPVITDTTEEADELMQIDEKESVIGMKYLQLLFASPIRLALHSRGVDSCFFSFSADAEVLSAPPKMVYSKLILR